MPQHLVDVAGLQIVTQHAGEAADDAQRLGGAIGELLRQRVDLGVELIAEGIKAAKSEDTDKVAAAIHAGTFKTPTGDLSFDDKGDLKEISDSFNLPVAPDQDLSAQSPHLRLSPLSQDASQMMNAHRTIADYPLTQDHIDQYRRDGFIVLPGGVVNADTIRLDEMAVELVKDAAKAIA